MKKISILLIAVMLLSIACLSLVACNTSQPVDNDNKVATSVVDGEGNDLSEGTHAFPQRMLFAYSDSVATYAAATPVATTTLTATITPDTAVNKAVTWTCSFVNPDSTWATGKDVSDYVTCEPESEGSLTCTVKCWQGFSEPINVVVTSVQNSEISATCKTDFIRPLTGMVLREYAGGSSRVFMSFGGTYDLYITPYLGEGTIDGDLWVDTLEWRLNDDLYNACSSAVTSSNAFTYQQVVWAYRADLKIGGYVTLEVGDCLQWLSYLPNDTTSPTQWKNAFTYYVGTNPNAHMCQLIMNYRQYYRGTILKSGTATDWVTFDAASLPTAVESISLSSEYAFH